MTPSKRSEVAAGAPAVTAVVVGEALCDLFAPEPGMPLAEAEVLVPQSGGAPANVAVQLARQGVPVELCTAVGADPMGARVLRLLQGEGVSLRMAQTLADKKTGLCLIEVDEAGERTFHPWRDRSADLALSVEHVDCALLAQAALVHRGTVSLRAPASRAAAQKAVRIVGKAGGLVSLDVNLRFRMFPSRERLLAGARGWVKASHVVKATDEEALALYGAADAGPLLAAGARLVCITRGAAGATLAVRGRAVTVASPVVRAVDATGCGDAFWGVVLAELLLRGVTVADLDDLDAATLEQIGVRACAAGARVVSSLGATRGMPRRADTLAV